MTDPVPSFRRNAAPTPNVVRSDATTLHVDFENVADTLITARNAGVVIDYQTRAQILHTFAFQGRRCAHIPPNPKGEQTQIRLIRAWDAPPAGDGAVLEFVYRPALDKPVCLHNWPIAQCFSPGGAPGAFDDHQRCYACVIRTADEYRLWYTANGFGRTGMGYATARVS